MKESMNDAKKVTPLSIEELMEMSYKDLLKLTKKKTTDEVTKRRAWNPENYEKQLLHRYEESIRRIR